jgi:hypothetical protein
MCVVIDDQLNVLPISTHMAAIKAVPPKTQVSGNTFFLLHHPVNLSP